MRILVVEDDLVSRLVMTGNLNKFGTCDVAADGIEAVEAVRLALEENNPYDLISLDIMMPNMDGQEALAQIRGLENKFGVVPGMGSKILMTTALSDIKNVSRAFKSECDGYITKPIDIEKLIAKLEEIEAI